MDDVYSDGGDLTLNGVGTYANGLVKAGILNLNGYHLYGFTELFPPLGSMFIVR